MSPKVPAAMLSRRGRKLSHFGNATRCDHSAGFAATRNRKALDRLSQYRHHYTAGDKSSHYEAPAPTHVWRKRVHAIVQHHAGRCRRSRIAPVRDRASYQYKSPRTPCRRDDSINRMRRGGPSVRYSVDVTTNQVVGGHPPFCQRANPAHARCRGGTVTAQISADRCHRHAKRIGKVGL